MSIYKPCDVRGDARTELTPELYRRWGRVLGRQAGHRRPFVAGGDVRGTTPEFLHALVDGLCEAGVQVFKLGVRPTPMIYFAGRHLRAAGCAIVTASHNPARINGLKWMIGNTPPTQSDVAMLRRESELPENGTSPPRTESQAADVDEDYVAWLQTAWPPRASCKQLRIVLDPMHGCWAARARSCLQHVFPEAHISAIHDTPRDDFGGSSPDCSRPEKLEELGHAVRQAKADLGLAFDGDGDRLALVDDRGRPLQAEQAAWLMLQSFGDRLQGQRFVHDVKFSDRVAEAAEQLGAEAVAERSGHAFIRRRMLDTAGLFGAEISGHYFFGELDGGDHGLYAACRMIAYLRQSGATLAELVRGAPAVFATPELRLKVNPQDRDAIIAQVCAAWSQYPQTTIDGVRVDFPDGWALVRSSVTEAALTFRFESEDPPGLDRLVRRFCHALPKFGEPLWQRYTTNFRDCK